MKQILKKLSLGLTIATLMTLIAASSLAASPLDENCPTNGDRCEAEYTSGLLSLALNLINQLQCSVSTLNDSTQSNQWTVSLKFVMEDASIRTYDFSIEHQSVTEINGSAISPFTTSSPMFISVTEEWNGGRPLPELLHVTITCDAGFRWQGRLYMRRYRHISGNRFSLTFEGWVFRIG